jgi:predicted DNA-binding transcriptional regulator YafY
LGAAAMSALAKVASALPADRRRWLETSRAYVSTMHIPKQIGERFEKLRYAIRERRMVDFVYAGDKKQLTGRCVRPLSLYFWGEHWTLGAWCELREDFRSFRVDRIIRLKIKEEVFLDESGKRLSDFLLAQGVPKPHSFI